MSKDLHESGQMTKEVQERSERRGIVDKNAIQ